MAGGLVAKIRSLMDGDSGVRKVADDPILTAELLLLFRMILADGEIDEKEMAAFRRICHEGFGIGPESVDAVVEYLNDFGYETSGGQALAMFRGLRLERRQALASHMADIAKADRNLASQEIKLLRRVLDILGLDPVDVIKGGK
ncbi:TerB family tellurite resistance protein [Arvimicrobium flavum]|uniref:tellurite resistance TerB family protein n=1 Tax=Arvimicrobium flavum TaxID=3393320 RepID=UPI00237BE426|nr:TerB family tellurite resistance protein [Mesorhizobium shangrilense]